MVAATFSTEIIALMVILNSHLLPCIYAQIIPVCPDNITITETISNDKGNNLRRSFQGTADMYTRCVVLYATLPSTYSTI